MLIKMKNSGFMFYEMLTPFGDRNKALPCRLCFIYLKNRNIGTNIGTKMQLDGKSYHVRDTC